MSSVFDCSDGRITLKFAFEMLTIRYKNPKQPHGYLKKTLSSYNAPLNA